VDIGSFRHDQASIAASATGSLEPFGERTDGDSKCHAEGDSKGRISERGTEGGSDRDPQGGADT
jgi:hypothetical protein